MAAYKMALKPKDWRKMKQCSVCQKQINLFEFAHEIETESGKVQIFCRICAKKLSKEKQAEWQVIKDIWDLLLGLLPIGLMLLLAMTGLGEFMWNNGGWVSIVYSLLLGTVCCYHISKSDDVSRAWGEKPGYGVVINPVGIGGGVVSVIGLGFCIVVILKSLWHLFFTGR